MKKSITELDLQQSTLRHLIANGKKLDEIIKRLKDDEFSYSTQDPRGGLSLSHLLVREKPDPEDMLARDYAEVLRRRRSTAKREYMMAFYAENPMPVVLTFDEYRAWTKLRDKHEAKFEKKSHASKLLGNDGDRMTLKKQLKSGGNHE